MQWVLEQRNISRSWGTFIHRDTNVYTLMKSCCYFLQSIRECLQTIFGSDNIIMTLGGGQYLMSQWRYMDQKWFGGTPLHICTDRTSQNVCVYIYELWYSVKTFAWVSSNHILVISVACLLCAWHITKLQKSCFLFESKCLSVLEKLLSQLAS